MSTRPSRSVTPREPASEIARPRDEDPSRNASEDDDEFRLAANDGANALVEIVVARIRRSSSGVFETVAPITKKHRLP